MPMIATTIISSMRVKPFWILRMYRSSLTRLKRNRIRFEALRASACVPWSSRLDASVADQSHSGRDANPIGVTRKVRDTARFPLFFRCRKKKKPLRRRGFSRPENPDSSNYKLRTAVGRQVLVEHGRRDHTSSGGRLVHGGRAGVVAAHP